MKSVWENFKGRNILMARYDHLTLEELRVEMGEAVQEVNKCPPGSVLLLVNVVGTLISPEALNLFKDTALKTKKQIHKTAVVGISGARRAMLEMVVKFSGMAVEPFETVEEAKDWLVLP